MIEKLKKKIDKEKSSRNVHIDYIKSFCNSPKAKELFKEDEEFKKLKEYIKQK